MIIGATTDLIRLLSFWVRRADSELASAAAANAARSMHANQFRSLDDARTLRDLESIPAAGTAATASQIARPIAISR